MNYAKSRYISALLSLFAIPSCTIPAQASSSLIIEFDTKQGAAKPTTSFQRSDVIFFDIGPTKTIKATATSQVLSLSSSLFRNNFVIPTAQELSTLANDPYMKPFKKGDQTQYLYTGPASKVSMPKTVGKINLSKVLPPEHFDNPMNIFIKASTVGEGNGIVKNNILIFKPTAMAHIDPGNNVLNISGISAQRSSRAHGIVSEMLNGEITLAKQGDIFVSGIYLEPGLEYSNVIRDYVLQSPIYVTESSLSDIFNSTDFTVQNGGQGGRDYDKVYLETLKWTRDDCIKYLKSSGLGTVATIYEQKIDVTSWPDEVLKTFVIRAKAVKDHEAEYGGLSRIAVRNGLSFNQQVMNDQGRRVYDMRFIYSKSEFEKIANAKISAFAN